MTSSNRDSIPARAAKKAWKPPRSKGNPVTRASESPSELITPIAQPFLHAAAPRLSRSFFERHPLNCARDLVGAVLTWNGCSGLVVETEAYAARGDEACHTFTRPATRRFIAEHKPGDAYVYLNYGMYWLLNVLVKGAEDEGFVLIRALQPLRGLRTMEARRGPKPVHQLCSGPGRLSVALGIDRRHHGQPIFRRFRAPAHPLPFSASPRIGISRARDLLWRFTADGNPHISAPPY